MGTITRKPSGYFKIKSFQLGIEQMQSHNIRDLVFSIPKVIPSRDVPSENYNQVLCQGGWRFGA